MQNFSTSLLSSSAQADVAVPASISGSSQHKECSLGNSKALAALLSDFVGRRLQALTAELSLLGLGTVFMTGKHTVKPVICSNDRFVVIACDNDAED